MPNLLVHEMHEQGAHAAHTLSLRTSFSVKVSMESYHAGSHHAVANSHHYCTPDMLFTGHGQQYVLNASRIHNVFPRKLSKDTLKPIVETCLSSSHTCSQGSVGRDQASWQENAFHVCSMKITEIFICTAFAIHLHNSFLLSLFMAAVNFIHNFSLYVLLQFSAAASSEQS